MTKTRKRMAGFLATLMLLGTSAVLPSSLASPKPPTNAGNGAGKSGQCTGAAAERPASCQSP